MIWKILGAVSQSTYFAMSYSGKLDHMLDRMQLNGACAIYIRKVAVIYASVAWLLVILNGVLSVYSVFFSGDYIMNITLTPLTTHVNLSELLVPRIAMFFLSVYNTGAWIFPHAMTFMLASIYTHQYKFLNRSFDKMLSESDGRQLSDSDIETFRQHHEEISRSISEIDDFLMFHNGGSFCCQLFDTILHLYDLFFFSDTDDPFITGCAVAVSR